MTIKMIAPGFQAGYTITAQSQTTYTADANGIIVAAPGDVQSLANAGCAIMPERPVVTLSSTGGYIVPGAINVLPSTVASTVSYAYLLAAPTANVLGQRTTIVQPAASTAESTITTSGCQFYGASSASTILTFSARGTIDIESIGSTLLIVTNVGVVASSLVVLTPALT
jgi:hypothetical protein